MRNPKKKHSNCEDSISISNPRLVSFVKSRTGKRFASGKVFKRALGNIKRKSNVGGRRRIFDAHIYLRKLCGTFVYIYLSRFVSDSGAYASCG